MTRGIFDPGSENVQRGAGNDFLGDQGVDRSNVPPSLTDKKVNPDAQVKSAEKQDLDAPNAPDMIDDEVQPTFNDNPDAAADELMHIDVEDEGQVDIDDADEPRQVE
jgi:hypothetical protein